MSFTRTRPFGFWATGTTVVSSEFEHLDDYAYAIDGRSGGAYSPTSLITIGGLGLTVTGPSQFANIQAAIFNCALAGTKGAVITQSTANTTGATITGNGTAAGVSVTGGSGGSGGIFTAGGGNKYGVEGFGTGSGTGVFGQGGVSGHGADLRAGIGSNASGIVCNGDGTGSGIVATAGASGAAVVAAGRISFTGTQPIATADPGANAAHATNQCKAWAHITTDGVGGITLHDAYNVASAVILATRIVITFARPMANATYSVAFGNIDGTLRFYSVDGPLAMVAATITIIIRNTSFATLDPTANVLGFSVQVHARQ